MRERYGMTTIRPARESDIESLRSLYREMSALHAALLPGLFRDDHGETHSESFWRSTLGAEGDFVLVAEVEQGVAGYALLLVRDTPEVPIVAPRRLAVLDELVVGSPYRRQGIGRSLLEACEALARERGATSLELRVWEPNTAALALYDSAGYALLQRRLTKPL